MTGGAAAAVTGDQEARVRRVAAVAGTRGLAGVAVGRATPGLRTLVRTSNSRLPAWRSNTDFMKTALAVLALAAMAGCATRTPRRPGPCCFARGRHPAQRCAG